MLKVFKNIGFLILALVITAGIYWIIYLDKKSKQDTLDYALTLLGKDLLAKIPESADKKPVQELYDEFLQQAAERKVAPEQVEYIAANILNLRYVDTTITPQQAEAIIKLSLEAPLKIERAASLPPKLDKEYQVYEPLPRHRKPRKMPPPERWEALGKRIRSLHEFNINIQRSMPAYDKKQQQLHKQIQCRVEEGLILKVNAEFKNKLLQRKFKKLAREMRQLEKERVLLWRENFNDDFNKEMEILRIQLDSLKELKELEGLEALESLKCLETQHYVPVIDTDSIRVIIRKSLEEAGIDDEDEE